MMYKSYRITNGKPKWIIMDNNTIVNRDPTKEEKI